MRLSENEVNLLIEIMNSEGPLEPHDLAAALNIKGTSIYKIINRLEHKGLIDIERFNKIVLSITQQAQSFKKLYYTHHTSPFVRVLAGERIILLLSINRVPKSVEELSEVSGIPKSSVYYFLNDLVKLGVVRKNRKQGNAFQYSFNYTLWGELKEFLVHLSETESLMKVPIGGLLIKDYGNDVLFKSIRLLDATPTSYSAYGKYGIQLFLMTISNYYTLPKRELSIRDVFVHSLDSANEIQDRMLCILFYLKNRHKLKSIKHPMMRDIRTILKHKHIKGYPSYEEVMDRMTVYAL
jgi:predicted transcriptional regulator